MRRSTVILLSRAGPARLEEVVPEIVGLLIIYNFDQVKKYPPIIIKDVRRSRCGQIFLETTRNNGGLLPDILYY